MRENFIQGAADAPDDRRSYRNSDMKIILLMLLIVSGFSFANELKPCRYQHINELEPIQVDSCISFTSQRSANDSDALITKEVALTANYNSNNIAYLYSEFGPHTTLLFHSRIVFLWSVMAV